MQKQNLLRFGFIAILLIASMILLRSFSTPKTQSEPCCRQTCPKKIKEPGGMIWESLSRQFFSSISTNY